MPVACSTSALTGQDGSLYYTPAGTKWCLEDFDDFPAGDLITVPARADFRVGDPVTFAVEGDATIDGGLTAGQAYTIATVAGDKITLTGVTIAGDGTDGTGHVKIYYDPFGAVCQIQSWDLEISRESLDVTTLPCGVGSGGATSGKYAKFKKFQPGYAEGSGSMTVLFTDNDDALGQRMLDNVMLSSQEGARVRLFLSTVSDGLTPAAPDLANSMFIEASISMNSMSVSVNSDDPVTLGYRIAFGRKPTKIELQTGIDFIKNQTDSYSGNKEKALTNYCGALMSSNEFIYIE